MIVEPTQFIFIKIIFGDGNILFAHFLASPTGKSHIRFGGICPVINDFSGGRSSDCPMEFVLHGLEKIDAGFGCGIVIDTCGIDIGYFLIKSLFRGTDILDATQKFIKIISSSRTKPLTIYSHSRWVAHWRNRVATWDFTR
jgi:hypothetical protein